MKSIAFLTAFALGTVALAAGPQKNEMHGDYVEARTASVFAGPCHYNGELMTSGREAVMAWNVTGGTWDGTDLAGVRAVAAVSSSANLGDDKASRKSELFIDSSATDAQAAAFTAAVKSRAGATLGEIVQVRRGTVTFRHSDDKYTIDAPHFASCQVQAMPDHECCKQPSLVWYTPLVPLADRRVGFTTDASYTSGKVSDVWERSDENSAFYGSFAL